MDENKDKIYYIPVEDIIPNRFQPRLAFDEKELNELANSIIKYGVIQPIVLRSIGEKYEIIAGERRYKASCIAGLKKIPAIINNTDDNTSAEIALLENLQRKNLSVIEEAQSYKKLMDRGFTQEDIAIKLGISQSAVANKMRLLNLPKEVQDALLYNRISERHARSLLSLNNEDLQKSLLHRITSEKLTVRQTEEAVSELLNRDKIEKEELPSDIQKFLKPEPVVESKEQVIGNNPVEEYLDIKVPDVVSIEPETSTLTEYTDDTEIINPFQSVNSVNPVQNNMNNNVTTNNEISSNMETPFISENTNNSYNTNNEVESEPVNFVKNDGSVNNTTTNNTYFNPYKFHEEQEEVKEEKPDEDSLLNEYGEVNLPKVINKVRDFVSGLSEVSSLIETSEVDLTDKYQIVIEINKNTPI